MGTTHLCSHTRAAGLRGGLSEWWCGIRMTRGVHDASEHAPFTHSCNLLLAPNHCGMERNNLWVRSNSRTMRNSKLSLTAQRTPNVDEFKLFKVRAIILITATARVWLKSGVFCSLSAQGCGHPSQPPQRLQKPFGPVLAQPHCGKLVSDLPLVWAVSTPFQPPKEPDWEHLNRKCNSGGDSRGSRYRRACSGSSGRVATSRGVTRCWRRLGRSRCSGSPARGRGWHRAAQLWNQKAVMEVGQKLPASTSSPAFV